MTTIDWDDRKLTLDLAEISTKQAIVMQGYTGMTLKPLLEGVGTGDPKALTAIAWLAYAQSGEQIPIADMDIPVLKFYAAYNAAVAAEREEAESKDPHLATEEADGAAEVAHVTSTPLLSAVNI